ncbi:MAG: NADP-dependent oxidoreductase [Alphaproteobacteria bacterium]|nr:NADP-dependent oxidoreductase [Alphaproteobacteria bacterium]
MAQHRNRRVILKTRATGLPVPELFDMVEDDAPEPGDGEVLINNIYVSADPGMKGWISTAKNYASVETGATMNSFGVGVVVESRNPDIAEGDYIVGRTGWQEYSIVAPEQGGFRKVDPADGPLSASLGVLGHSAITAYFGLLDVGRPNAGETVLVSTAAGSVGSAVGQFANIKGCRTVGIAGGPEKAALCREVFGYDVAIDYKATDDLAAALQEACPEGIDVYYDNVGGDTLDTVLGLMNQNGRVVICGTAATEAWVPPPTGLRFERHVLVNRLRIQGFILFDYQDRYEDALADIRQWFKEGKLNYREDIAEGLENAPAALAGLYEGRNKGRQLIRVRPDPTLS